MTEYTIKNRLDIIKIIVVKIFDHEVYYYGNGLLYQKSYSITVKSGGTAGSDNGTLLVYHYDHLGSTKFVTDRAPSDILEM